MYVDDLIMLGPRQQLGGMLLRVRRGGDMEDPHQLGKYLGCYHRMVERVDPKSGATVTEVEWDMTDYNKSAVARYEGEDFCSEPLPANVSTPFPSKVTAEELDRLLEAPGELNQTQRASHLMKLLYGSRTAWPPIAVVIARLASFITKWNGGCDRRLRKLMEYVKSAHDLVLSGCLSSEDRDTAELWV